MTFTQFVSFPAFIRLAVPRFLVGLALLLAASAPVHAVTTFDDDVTPDAIFGSGNSNGSFTVDRSGGVELGLRAKIPFDGTVQSNGDGTYSYTLAQLLAGHPSQRWNFDWTVNTDWDSTSGFLIDDLTYLLELDFDPGPGADFLAFDPITPLVGSNPTPLDTVDCWDHSIGTNGTANGGGAEASCPDAPGYAGLIAANNVAQQSWRHAFFPIHPSLTYDPTIPGVYDVVLTAFSGITPVASTSIQVIVGGTINTSNLSENGWYSDDTRADGTGSESAGTNLISDTLTDDPEATASGTPAHDADIHNQISFGFPPGTVPASTHELAVHLQIGSSGSGKSQITHRKDDGVGHGPGSAFGPGFSATYSWMGDGTASVTASLKFGIKTAEFGSTGVSPRTGENAWDKVLIYEPGNLNGGVSDGTWKTETVSHTSGKWWFFDRTASAGTIGTPMTLADMAGALGASTLVGGGPKTVKDVYDLITAPGAHITSTQFGIGSGNANGSVYVNQLVTNAYRAGTITTFGGCGDRYVGAGSDTDNNCLLVGTPCATVKHAIDEACPGETINVAAGTYPEGPQLVIDKDLSIVGAGKVSTVLEATANTGTVGNARGWFLVDTGVVFNLSDLTLDGAGFKIWQGIRHIGAGGTVDNVLFVDMAYQAPGAGSPYAGTGIAMFGTGPVDVTNCMLTGNGRQGIFYFGSGVNGSVASGNMSIGKGPGDHLDYGIEVGSDADVTLIGNVISGNRGVASSDGSTSAAILISTFFGSGLSAAVIDGNVLEDNSTGIFRGFDSADTAAVTATCNRIHDNDNGIVVVGSSATSVVANDNSLVGNLAGVAASAATGGPVDAADNWWGVVDGPSEGGGSGATGSGDSVTVNVTFSPFATSVPACVNCSADAQCDDGLACNGSETCNLGTSTCEAGTPVPCTDQCETGVCVEPSGTCELQANGFVCSATPDACTLDDTCQAGLCTDGGGGDGDADGVCSADDNCPVDANPGQDDQDTDGQGDVCDLNETPEPNINKVILKRESAAAKSNGSVVVKGDFISDPQSLFTTSAQITLRVQDAGGFSSTKTWDFATECQVNVKGRVKCKSADRRYKGTFKPFGKTPQVFKLRASFKKQGINVGTLFGGPVTVTLTFGPPPPALGSIDRVGTIIDCQATGRGLKCRE